MSWAISVVSWNDVLKQHYPAEAIKTMSMSRHPLLSALKRDDERYYEAYTLVS